MLLDQYRSQITRLILYRKLMSAANANCVESYNLFIEAQHATDPVERAQLYKKSSATLAMARQNRIDAQQIQLINTEDI